MIIPFTSFWSITYNVWSVLVHCVSVKSAKYTYILPNTHWMDSVQCYLCLSRMLISYIVHISGEKEKVSCPRVTTLIFHRCSATGVCCHSRAGSLLLLGSPGENKKNKKPMKENECSHYDLGSKVQYMTFLCTLSHFW